MYPENPCCTCNVISVWTHLPGHDAGRPSLASTFRRNPSGWPAHWKPNVVDVVDVEDITREEHFERELLLIKVKAKLTQVGALWSATQKAGGRVLWDSADSFTIELTSSEAEINNFIASVGNRGEVLEVVRSGALAIQKGRESLEQ